MRLMYGFEFDTPGLEDNRHAAHQFRSMFILDVNTQLQKKRTTSSLNIKCRVALHLYFIKQKNGNCKVEGYPLKRLQKQIIMLSLAVAYPGIC